MLLLAGVTLLQWPIQVSILLFEPYNVSMTPLDMVVGSYDGSKGVGYLVDLWSTSQDTPAFDKHQDVTVIYSLFKFQF